MKTWTMRAAAFGLGAFALLSACAAAPAVLSANESDQTASAKPAKTRSAGEVYLFRGGLNVFSTGLDDLAEKMRARGIDAHSEPHGDWPGIAADLRKRYAANKAPIALIGHSWGALATVLIANELEKSNIPVALIILYDTTDSVKIPPNVRRVINFRSSTTIGLNLTVTGEYGFRGKIENINVPQFNHLDMDSADPLHDQSIKAVLQVIRPRAKAAG